MAGVRFVSRCSCGFVSQPFDVSTDAVAAYRDHETGHEPGQRTGDIEAVEAVEAVERERRRGVRSSRPKDSAASKTTESLRGIIH